ncbi:MAG: hypothetical protein ACAI35_01100 [Candidatus Methylacidiphilales bacterium]|nr:hypothetical protein [Candidatus Methylacidiphilales bacterium]
MNRISPTFLSSQWRTAPHPHKGSSVTLAPAFSMVEMILAISITSFCLLAILSLFSVGIRTGQQARDYTSIAGAASRVLSDVQGRTNFTLPATLFFDAQGQPTTNSASALYACDISLTTVPQSEIAAVSTNLGRLCMQFTWPASLPAASRKNTNAIYATLPKD